MRQLYTWKAVYTDGTSITEFKPDGSSCSFYDIDKTRLAQFILTGEDFRIWFNARTGDCYINNEQLFIIPDEILNLPVSYGDGLIQYKHGEDHIINKVIMTGSKELEYGRRVNLIASHYLGYKVVHNNKKYQVLFRVIPDDPTTHIPMDTKVDVRITITDLTTDEVTESTVEVVK